MTMNTIYNLFTILISSITQFSDLIKLKTITRFIRYATINKVFPKCSSPPS